MAELCKNCKKNKACHGRRGLCWGCHQDPAIRAANPSTSKYNPNKYRGLTDEEILALTPEEEEARMR